MTEVPFFFRLVERTDCFRRHFEGSSNVLDIVANGLNLARYRHFLQELYHVVWHFNPTCAAAAARVTDRHRDVRYFLYEHMNEEKGHEVWVLNDLEAVGISEATAKDYAPSMEMLALNAYNYWSAEHRHPCSVLGMLYALEVIASVYGGPMTTAISESLLLQGDRGISFIASHATLDAEHMAELKVILDGVHDKDAQEAIVESVCFNFHQFGRVMHLI